MAFQRALDYNRGMETVHTPRLCIDGRIASENPAKGILAQEVIEQLVAGRGEPEGSSSWIEKHRTVLLAHPAQVFSGQLKRFDTNTPTPVGPVSWFWEKNFLRSAEISAFHRFRPIDQLHPTPRCATVTTLLPPKGRMPFFLSRRTNQFYVVPSHGDRRILTMTYQVDPEQLFIVSPSVRRYAHFVEKFTPLDEQSILILIGDKEGKQRLPRLSQILSTRYPGVKQRVFSLKERDVAQPQSYLKILQGTKLCFYLSAAPFDWATLALESLYWGVPTLFADKNSALNDLLPHSSLRLSQFLVDLPDLLELKLKAQSARLQLDAAGAFDPLGLAKHFTRVYQSALSSLN